MDVLYFPKTACDKMIRFTMFRMTLNAFAALTICRTGATALWWKSCFPPPLHSCDQQIFQLFTRDVDVSKNRMYMNISAQSMESAAQRLLISTSKKTSPSSFSLRLPAVLAALCAWSAVLCKASGASAAFVNTIIKCK